MDRRQFTIAAGAVSLAGLPSLAHADDVLKRILTGAHRQAGDKARDPYRHPEETLTFFGLRPGMTIVEITPGTGYLDILAPYAKATGGRYVATGNDTAFRAQAQNAELYGPIAFTGVFNRTSGPLVPAGTADMVVTFRNFHNWYWQTATADQPSMAEKAFRDFHAALKPGGILGLEDHRADPRPETVQAGRKASDGYVSKASILAVAQAAGFRPAGESEINANPKDTKDHPFGVWTLPPTNRTSQAGVVTPADFNPEKYRQIGESDRMTLRFVKA